MLFNVTKLVNIEQFLLRPNHFFIDNLCQRVQFGELISRETVNWLRRFSQTCEL